MSENKKKLQVIFMGTPEFSAYILTSLLEAEYNIVGVFTQADKKVGRKQTIEKSPVRLVAEKNNLPVFTPKKLDEAALIEIQNLKADLIILVAYGKILPQTVLSAPRLGAINIHPSLLPKFRGPSPIQNALLAGNKITGTTIMLMDAGVDTGDILRQKEIVIAQNETYLELAQKLDTLSSQLLLETLPDFLAGKIVPQKQDDVQTSYCQIIKKTDGQINWHDSAENIYNKYRAFFNWPGIFTIWNGKRLKLNKINFISDNSSVYAIGEVFRIDDIIYVQAEAGWIELIEIQLEGKPSTKIFSFVNGHKNFVGSKLI